MKKDVLLFSGGLDSYIAYYYLGEPTAIFVNMKHKYADIELERVHQMISQFNMNIIIDNDTFDFSRMELPNAIIPNRNMYLAMLASNYGDNIWMAACDGDYNLDKNPEIFNKASSFFSALMDRNIKVDTPFWDWTKTDMIRWYLKNGYPKEGLYSTYSCFNNGERHCGRCPSCLRRWIGFYNNDLALDFDEDPITWSEIPNYIERFTHGTQEIDTIGRKKEFFEALFKHGYNVPKTDVEWIEKIRRKYL